MREISIQPTRTRQFLTRIPGLSMKSLQERLKELEAAGMLNRVKFDEKIPRVEHHITSRGIRLLGIMVDIKKLAEENSSEPCQCPIEAQIAGEPQDPNSCPRRRVDN